MTGGISDKEIPDGYKKCSSQERCSHPVGPVLPATADYFYKFARSRDGLQARCKVCQNLATNNCRDRRPEGTKKYYDSHKEERKKYREAHKERINAHNTAYYIEHKEERKDYARKYTREHKDEIKKYRESHREESRINSARYAISHREELRKYAAEWRSKHPDKVRERLRRRYARKIGVEIDFSVEDEKRAVGYWEGCCAVCGTYYEGRIGQALLHLDHWVPLCDKREDNPGTVPSNMVPLCATCNKSKNGTDPVVWLTRKYGDEQAQIILSKINAYFEWVQQEVTK